MIHFDLDERYEDEAVVGSAISRRDGVLLSVIFHGLVAAAFIIGPQLSIFQPSPEELAQRQAEIERQREAASRRFVFVQPQVDLKSLEPPPRAELSDENRRAQDPVIARAPENPLPFSRGNTSERVEAAEAERARGPDQNAPPQPEPESQLARVLPPSDSGLQRPSERPVPRIGGSLGEALRNLQQYVQNETFDNPQGGNDRPGATIQFDTKGVEFGPWLRRFIAQVRRNWFIPQAAMVMSGHVILQFNIHRSGEISDIAIVQPSLIDAFTRAAYGAIYSSNPTAPLPPEYPSDKALFTVTFYYNEEPPN
ncbi:MAG: TonB C-terminal domain-containing protein [Acidobacteria bacterium]|nr:TonB C-terminal domain-containing protein [Acidobacteriota bacterium]